MILGIDAAEVEIFRQQEVHARADELHLINREAAIEALYHLGGNRIVLSRVTDCFLLLCVSRQLDVVANRKAIKGIAITVQVIFEASC